MLVSPALPYASPGCEMSEISIALRVPKFDQAELDAAADRMGWGAYEAAARPRSSIFARRFVCRGVRRAREKRRVRLFGIGLALCMAVRVRVCGDTECCRSGRWRCGRRARLGYGSG